MTNAFLLSRARLQFQNSEDDLLRELSAIARTPEGSLWVGSDEYLTLERLSPAGEGLYANHTPFHLNDYLQLAGDASEIDIEGLDYADGYLWVVGSHGLKRNKPKGEGHQQDIARLANIKRDANRYLLARLPVQGSEIVSSHTPSGRKQPLTAAKLQSADGCNPLMSTLAEDEHLGPFIKMGLPSKDNGFDIEGIAVSGDRIFLGLRGPVLRGWAIILEIEIEDTHETGHLDLKVLNNGAHYRKHFLDLNGQGIRELCLHQDDLIILAGPTMALSGVMQVFKLKNALSHSKDTIWSQETGALSVIFDLPHTVGADNAEGMTLSPCLGYDQALMVAYDSPSDTRIVGKDVFVDIFRLPERH